MLVAARREISVQSTRNSYDISILRAASAAAAAARAISLLCVDASVYIYTRCIYIYIESRQFEATGIPP